ncbi:MAG: FAD-dependent oxidoreductase [Betaproteobacteria bacterium]|nr:FAD-dependent oxidoreductase [Betaproteobacteria bacterium]
MGGLLAANLLHRAGWDVQVFERVGEALAGRGAGIITHDKLFDAIRRAGAVVDGTMGCATHSRVTLDRAGKVLAEMPLEQILTAWGRLYRLLKDVFPAARYHFDKSLTRIEQDAATVTAHFADGSRTVGELLIGADGIRSTVRAQLLPQSKPQYVGYLAWRGLADENAVSDETRRALSDRMGFGLPPGEQILSYLVTGHDNSTRPGHRRFNFVWYRPADEQTGLRDLLTDAAGRHYEYNIPPDRIRREVIAEMHAAAERLLAPAFVDIVRATAEPLFQPVYDLESTELAFGRVALLGDAAFVARPHVGLGVTKAAGDAQSLVDALTAQPDDVAAGVKEYAAKRLEFGRTIVAHARLLGLSVGIPENGGPQSPLMAYLRRPEIVIREIAVPDWAERTLNLSRL